MAKLFSFHTVLFSCTCGCGTIYSDAEIGIDPDGEFVEGVDVKLHTRLVVRYTYSVASVKAAREKLIGFLQSEECDEDAAVPVLHHFAEHVEVSLEL